MSEQFLPEVSMKTILKHAPMYLMLTLLFGAMVLVVILGWIAR